MAMTLHSWINNEEVPGKEFFHSLNPFNNEVVAEISKADEDMMEKAVKVASEAFPEWSNLPIRERGEYLRKISAVILDKRDEISELIAREQGKPVSETFSVDIIPVLEHLKYLAKNAHNLFAPKRIDFHQALFCHKKGRIEFESLGVIAIITPWNFPFSIPFIEVISALITGNTVVMKTATATTAVGLKIGEIIKDAGLPAGVVNVITLPGRETDALVQHPEVRKVVFTGSVEIGRHVMEKASKNLTPIVLELGGKDPAVVAEDALVDRAVDGIVWGGFMNAGQVCASIERVYVHKNIAEEFIKKIKNKVEALRIGDPLDPETDVGPLTVKEQALIIENHIKDALEKGAKVLTGGERGEGQFFKPTILIDVNHSMKVMREESFGPVLPIMVVDSIEEAIQLANDTSFGLTASGWTSNKETAKLLQKELKAGTVTINDAISSFSEPTVGWGGLKESGFGRTHSVFGLYELVNIKHVNEDFSIKKAIWWFPYDRSFSKFIRSSLDLLYSPEIGVKLKSLLKVVFISRFWRRIRIGSVLFHIKKIF